MTNKLVPIHGYLIHFIAIIGLSFANEADSANRSPNVVFFLADDLGVECLGAYGSETYRTPNLDRLAAEGMRLNRCYAGPACTPSRVALMTGKYNHRNYVNFSMLPRGERTFAHMVKDAGYRTRVVSSCGCKCGFLRWWKRCACR
jgi:arylsulfatase A